MADNEVTILRREVEQLRLQLATLQDKVDRLAEGEAVSNGRYPKAAQTTWYDVEDWVVNVMQDTLERRATNSRRWCPEWYKHPEVLTRFRLLYQTYREVEGLDAISYSMWFIDHLDRHLDAICSPDGPFAACSPERHAPHRGLTIARNANAEQDWGPRPGSPLTNPTKSKRNVRAVRTKPSPVEVKP
jgi:hypothetical protein